MACSTVSIVDFERTCNRQWHQNVVKMLLYVLITVNFMPVEIVLFGFRNVTIQFKFDWER